MAERSRGESLLAKNDFSPAVYGNLRAWLDASDPKYFSIDDEGTAPVTGQNFIKWYDLSGNGRHAVIEAGTPYWRFNSAWLDAGADLNGDRLILENSETGMDGWSKLHVFTTFRFDSNTRWQYLFGKTSSVNDSNVAVWHFGLRNGNYPPQIRSWAVTNNNAWKHEGNQAPTASIKQNLGLLSIFYNGTNFIVNRWYRLENEICLRCFEISSHYPCSIRTKLNIKFGEFVVFNDALSSSDEQKMEGYLAHKWGLEETCQQVTPTSQVLQFLQQVGLSSGLPPGKIKSH